MGPLAASAFLVGVFLIADFFLLGAALVVPSEVEDPLSAPTSTIEYCRLLATLGGILFRILRKEGEQEERKDGEESQALSNKYVQDPRRMAGK